MSGLDHSLIYEANKLMNGANVHGLKLNAFLRQFVASRNDSMAACLRAEHARIRSAKACAASDVA
jgi:hypothetical protein